MLDFQKVLKDVAEEYLVNINTVQAFSKVAVENMLKNADYVRTGYQAKQLMEAIPREMPAIIVSAGPSLNKNIEELKKAKNKAFIIASGYGNEAAFKKWNYTGYVCDYRRDKATGTRSSRRKQKHTAAQ